MRPASRRGGAAVELALILPVLMALMLGALEWGWYLDQSLAVVHVARDAAYAGALTPAARGPDSVARARAEEALLARGYAFADVRASATLVPGAFGPEVEVAIDVTYRPLVLGVLTPGRLGASATALLEDR